MGNRVKWFVFFLSSIFSRYAVTQDLPIYERYADEIINSFAREMNKKYGLVCIGSGGQMPTNVATIIVTFNAYHRATLQEARELVVQAKEALINKVNSHEKIRPYLKTYPFTGAEAQVNIAFHKPHSGSYYLDGSVAFVCAADRGKNISYSVAQIQKVTLPGLIDQDGTVLIPKRIVEEEVFVDLLTETCEEALAIVKAEQANEKAR